MRSNYQRLSPNYPTSHPTEIGINTEFKSLNLECKREGGLRFREKKKKSHENRPLISIITASYNAEKDLLWTFKSIREQTYDNIEWIIIDGASTDETVSLIKKNEDIVDYWISEPDKGIADAWNKGLSMASGDGILILNAGDVYSPDALSIFARNFNPNKIVCASAKLISEARAPLGVFQARPSKLSHGMFVPHNWCLVPKPMYKLLGGYPGLQYSMDFAWFYRYYRRFGTSGFFVLQDILGEYLLGGFSDKHFTKGFIYNANIMVSAGRSPIIAWLCCGVAILKHWLHKNLVRHVLKIK